MKRIFIIAAAASLALVGCQQQKGPQTTELADAPQPRPVEELLPSPQPQAQEPAQPTPEPAAETTAAEPAPTPPPAGTPRSHTLQKGDTLWSLAVKYLGQGRRWPEIVQANPELHLVPKRLPVGKTIIIPEK